jgi:hypothetical protein
MRPVALHDRQTRTPSSGVAVHVAQENPMLDIFMLALGLGFFAVSIGYAYACERL